MRFEDSVLPRGIPVEVSFDVASGVPVSVDIANEVKAQVGDSTAQSLVDFANEVLRNDIVFLVVLDFFRDSSALPSHTAFSPEQTASSLGVNAFGRMKLSAALDHFSKLGLLSLSEGRYAYSPDTDHLKRETDRFFAAMERDKYRELCFQSVMGECSLN